MENNVINLIEAGITSIDNLTIVENEKLRKYDILAKELSLIYKCETKIIPYVITWDGVVTQYHKTYLQKLNMPPEAEAYAQTIVLRKTLELISLGKRRCIDEDVREDEIAKSIRLMCENTGSTCPI